VRSHHPLAEREVNINTIDEAKVMAAAAAATNNNNHKKVSFEMDVLPHLIQI
jgi:hypothetical protein